ncbi:MAG: hypothetical protein ACYC35_08860 [Pirellulales bacterium]
MTTPALSLPYSAANAYLAQGDIFKRRLVAPLADDEIRILRSEAGRHGQHVLSGESGRLFSYDELVDTLTALPPNEQEGPFQTSGGPPLEYVVVPAGLVEYFMLASQTCDVSGVDGAAKPFAAVVPVVSVSGYLSRERLPLGLLGEDAQDKTQWTTIVDYLQDTLKEDLGKIRDDPFGLPDKVRQVLRGWQPPKKSNEHQVRGKILNVLGGLLDSKRSYIYYLPLSRPHRVPESYVDFTRLVSIGTDKLNDLKQHRVSSLASPYREEFANKLGLYLSRIATPAPLVPPKI